MKRDFQLDDSDQRQPETDDTDIDIDNKDESMFGKVDTGDMNHCNDSDTVQGSDAESQEAVFSSGETLF